MTQGAHVSSVDALLAFRAALQRFIDEAEKALIEVDIEIHRFNDWITKDQPAYWKHEMRTREEAIAQAKDDLRRVTLSIAMHRPSAVEQKKALKRAQERHERAREKAETTRRWRTLFERAINEYRGQSQHIAAAIEADLPRALGLVERMAADLDSYLTVAPPQTGIEPGEGAETAAAASVANPILLRRKPAGRPKKIISLEECQALRSRTLSKEEREAIDLGSPWSDLPARRPGEAAATPIEMPDPVRKHVVSVKQGDIVVYERGALKESRFFLARIDTQAPGDSGWFAGHISEPARPRARHRSNAGQTGAEDPYAACTISRLLAALPELESVVTLPPGYLVVIHNRQIEIMLDRNDNVILDWNREAGGPEGTA